MVKEFIPVNSKSKNIYNNPTNFETVGARLRFERERKGYGVTELANLCLVTKATQINYESDKGKGPDTSYLLKLDTCGLDVFFIVTGRRVAAHGDNELNNLIDAYTQASPTIKRAVFGVLSSEYSNEITLHQKVQGYFSNQIIGNDDPAYNKESMLKQKSINLLNEAINKFDLSEINKLSDAAKDILNKQK